MIDPASTLSAMQNALQRGTRRELTVAGLLGAMAFTWHHLFVATFGSSLPVLSGYVAGVCISLGLGLFLHSRVARWFGLYTVPVLAAWTVVLPNVLAVALRSANLISLGLWNNSTVAIGCAFLWTVATIGPAAVLAMPVLSMIQLDKPSHPHTKSRAYLALGWSLGIAFSGFVAAPWIGVHTTGMVAAVLLLVSAFCQRRALASPTDAPSATALALRTVIPVGLVVGGCLAIASRITDQLGLPAAWNGSAIAAGLGFGVAIGALLKRPLSTAGMVYSSLGACLVLCVTFSQIVFGFVALAAYVEWSFALHFTRLAFLVAIAIPFGLSLSAGFATRSAAGITCASACCGWLAVRWFGIPFVGVTDSLLVIATMGVCYSLMHGLLVRGTTAETAPRQFIDRLPRPIAAICARTSLAGVATLAIVIGGGWLHWACSYQPSHSAKLLFDTQVFLAHRAGIPTALLPHLDEGRHLATIDGRDGTYTVWRYRGSRRHVSLNGVPEGGGSDDVARSPELTGAQLTAVLPVVLHERPKSGLILGLGSGRPLATLLSFPLQQIRCVTSDPTGVEVVRNFMQEPGTWDDDRLEMTTVDPVIALSSTNERYDIVISNLHEPSVASSTPHFTDDFYRAIASRLTTSGVFCQRLHYTDLGPSPLQELLVTLNDAFSSVLVLEVGIGEWLCLGTNASMGFSTEELVERLQRPHVREALAKVGWDWSNVLQLSALDANDVLVSLYESGVPTNTTRNSRFAFRVPMEVNRWGDKVAEIRSWLQSSPSSLVQWAGPSSSAPSSLRRLEDAVALSRLIYQHPDEWWHYRKASKSRLQQSRPTVQLVGATSSPEAQLHPEDRFRMRYLRALSSAAKADDPSIEQIRHVASFVRPFDPLIGYFLHHEVAALYERIGHPEPSAELDHRLYTIHFATAPDRSVLNVTDAMELLANYPSACPKPADRYDQLNALCQVLRERWDLRSVNPIKKLSLEISDCDNSIKCLRSALNAMSAAATEAGLEGAELRRDVLERKLLRPLRSYKSRLLDRQSDERLNRAIEATKAKSGDGAQTPPQSADL